MTKHIFRIIGILVLAGTSVMAQSNANTPQKSSSPIELVLSCDQVAFDTPTNILISLSYRNVGSTNMDPLTVLGSQSIVWDSKEYKQGGNNSWVVGPGKLVSMSSMHVSLTLSAYNIPAKALTSGRHQVAIKAASSQSNALTIFIGSQYRPTLQ